MILVFLTNLNDINIIDPYHLEAYNKQATSYNRDVASFPLLQAIFKKIYGDSKYKSPTEMGVNMIGFAIKDMDVANKKIQIINIRLKSLI